MDGISRGEPGQLSASPTIQVRGRTSGEHLQHRRGHCAKPECCRAPVSGPTLLRGNRRVGLCIKAGVNFLVLHESNATLVDVRTLNRRNSASDSLPGLCTLKNNVQARKCGGRLLERAACRQIHGTCHLRIVPLSYQSIYAFALIRSYLTRSYLFATNEALRWRCPWRPGNSPLGRVRSVRPI